MANRYQRMKAKGKLPSQQAAKRSSGSGLGWAMGPVTGLLSSKMGGKKSLGQRGIDAVLPKDSSTRQFVKDATFGTDPKLKTYDLYNEDQMAQQAAYGKAGLAGLQQQANPQQQAPLTEWQQVMQNLGNIQFNQPQQGQSGWNTAGDIAGGLGDLVGAFAPKAGEWSGTANLASKGLGLLGKGLNYYGGTQNQAQDQLNYQNAFNQLGGQQNQLDFAPIRQEAIRQFNQQTIPGIAERFAALGGGQSSAFRNARNQAEADLQSQLASMQQQANMQNRGLNNEQMRMAMHLLGQQTGAREQQQQFGQNQQRMGMEERFNMGNLGLGQQRENLAQRAQQQALFRALAELGQQQQRGNYYQAGQPGLINKFLDKGSDLAFEGMRRYAMGGV